MSEQSIIDFLTEITQENPVSVHKRGFAYLHHGLLPRLLDAGKNKTVEENILARCWFIVGSIYSYNNAPKRAIECLLKSHVLNTNNSESLKLLIQQQLLIGEYYKAFENVHKAIDLEPDNFKLITLQQRIQDDMNYNSEPQYTSVNQLWELNELLASEQFETVVNTVLNTEMDNVDLLKCLANAFGALSHHANYIKVWESIFAIQSQTKLSMPDLFYMPVEIQKNKLFSSLL
ncbi:MAG: hypothetical protein PF541_08575 [Prolixibacteraceae bacterium]|jgi:tetratricopeptide (TPR) repeat protein|nr:hypothetical protein [Prolixibacteraceae bacterium]